MDENNIILLLWSKISNLIDEKTSKLKFDKTFKATIWEINTDGTYQINYKGQIYSVPNALDTTLSLGQSVWVKIPCGILRNMHICGVINK